MQIIKINVSGNGKGLLIYINMGFSTSDYSLNTMGYNSTPVMQINCSGMSGGANFGNQPYSVVAFQAN